MSLWAPVIFSSEEGEQLQQLGEAFVGATSSSDTAGTCSHRLSASSVFAVTADMAAEVAVNARS